jgi:betaine lipid synthase
MGTIKTYNGRNNFLNTYFISIPFYIFLGCSRRRDVSSNTKSFHEEAGSTVGVGQGGLLTPVSPFMKISSSSPSTTSSSTGELDSEFFTLGPSMLNKDDGHRKKGSQQTIVDMGAPLSPFHYQLKKVGLSCSSVQVGSVLMAELAGPIFGVESPRAIPNAYLWMGMSFLLALAGLGAHQQVWEDPKVDVERLGIVSEDSVLAITSAGDNVLHYALAAKCKAIHAVGRCFTSLAEVKTC